eukprot:TRINITY_DN71953_c0_g1_i1.p1 TRINITY_DN71953_c0_g1~~TRINITY_DN71953_c0_g1_i1.p1  ORF type:complete len:642 (-),score=78.53 TRINITY_DN71953_c0_g1_i1:361-2286(-)
MATAGSTQAQLRRKQLPRADAIPVCIGIIHFFCLPACCMGAAAPSCATYGCENSYRPANDCQCNSKCAKFGSCCSDYESTCSRTCSGRCDAGFDADAYCQCTNECSRYENCCQDYTDTCGGAETKNGAQPESTPSTRRSGSSPSYRDPSVREKIHGISYGPSPELVEGKLLPNDDFMSPMAALQWDTWGRGDLEIMRTLGANHVRLYGNDPSQDHGPFLDKAKDLGISAIVGLSDWPYLQMPGNCKETEYDCFQQIYESYKQNLANGFTVDGGEAYHAALKALIVVNEPELKMGSFGDASAFCRSVVSAVDGILQAEKDVGVTNNLIALTVTVSFAKPFGEPGLGQMRTFHDCFMDPSGWPAKYKAKNDVKNAYLSRWVNSLNTFNSPSEIKHLLFDPYPHYFWNSELQIPVFIGEYHYLRDSVYYDLPKMVEFADNHDFFLGLSFFEFSRRYDKSGQDRAKEMKYGMFGLDKNCAIGTMRFFCAWWTGKRVVQSYKVRSLVALDDPGGGDKSIAAGVAHTYGGSVPRHTRAGSCTPIRYSPTAAVTVATEKALVAAGCTDGSWEDAEGIETGGRHSRRWLWVVVGLLGVLVACAGLGTVLFAYGTLSWDDIKEQYDVRTMRFRGMAVDASAFEDSESAAE